MKLHKLKLGALAFTGLLLGGYATIPATIAQANEAGGEEVQELDPTFESDVLQSGILVQVETSDVSLDKFDKYVQVENNQFVLNLPQVNEFSSEEVDQALAQIAAANEVISDNGAEIDLESGSAYIPIATTYAHGSTYVRAYWNYFDVGIDRTTLRGGVTGAVSGISGALAAYFSFGTLTAVVSSVVGGMVGAWTSQRIHSGIWFHLNYAAGVNKRGWQ